MDKHRLLSFSMVQKAPQLIPDIAQIRVPRQPHLHDLPCLEFQDEEDVVTDKAQDIDREEVAGEQGLPMGGEEALPVSRGLDVPILPPLPNRPTDRFRGNLMVECLEETRNPLGAAQRVEPLHFQDEVPEEGHDGRPALLLGGGIGPLLLQASLPGVEHRLGFDKTEGAGQFGMTLLSPDEEAAVLVGERDSHALVWNRVSPNSEAR